MSRDEIEKRVQTHKNLGWQKKSSPIVNGGRIQSTHES